VACTEEILMKKPELKPWARGPYELIRHADGHRVHGSDTDRRIALIGYDNAVEVCVDVYVRLHPKLKDGKSMSKAEVENHLANYHTKLEFLDHYLQSQGYRLDPPIETVVWCHQLRNELYHSGNGMVPEEHVIEAASRAAKAVFQFLFGADYDAIGAARPYEDEPAESFPEQAYTTERMQFLEAWIEFEERVHYLARVFGDQPKPYEPPLRVLERSRAFTMLPDGARQTVLEARRVRDRIVHGGTISQPEALPDMTRGIRALAETVRELAATCYTTRAEE
jgi:hypothetical protein